MSKVFQPAADKLLNNVRFTMATIIGNDSFEIITPKPKKPAKPTKLVKTRKSK